MRLSQPRQSRWLTDSVFCLLWCQWLQVLVDANMQPPRHILHKGPWPGIWINKEAKAFSPASSSTFNILGYQVGGSMRHLEKGYQRVSRTFSGRRDIYSQLVLLFGYVASWPDRPSNLAGPIKQGGPRKPVLTLSGVPSFTSDFELTDNG